MNEGHMQAATALVLAAGRGERMRPLTDVTPKPLLEVGGLPLIGWHLRRLAQAGHRHVVVNTAWLEEQVVSRLGSVWQDPQCPELKLAITFSQEGRDFGGALETGGGIVRALPHLADVFWVVAGDVFAPDLTFSMDIAQTLAASPERARLWLVPNPPHHPQGDFGLAHDRVMNLGPQDASPRHTFSTVGLYKQTFFTPPVCEVPLGNPKGQRCALAPWLRRAMDLQWVCGELFESTWVDVGTPERLQTLRNRHG